MPAQKILRVIGASEHNLKHITVEIPRNAMTVVTGLSGSGKSSLAFDTIYAEGQRRYVESLSSYARQFLDQLQKPKVEHIEGLSPAISIEQKSVSRNPRSTVGTVTEIYDYLRVLYANVGRPHCPHCRRPLERQTVQDIVDAVLGLPKGSRLLILAPVVRGRKGEYGAQFDQFMREGFTRAKVDGKVVEMQPGMKLNRRFNHSISVVIDRLIVGPDIKTRLTDSVEMALKKAEGLVAIEIVDRAGEPAGPEQVFSESMACPEHGPQIIELSPRMFSFNSPYGACPSCNGLGLRSGTDDGPEGGRMVAHDGGEPCAACGGMRLKPESLAVTIGGANIAGFCRLTVEEAARATARLKWTARERRIAEQPVKEIRDRLDFLLNVGLGYLTLDRPAGTLAGGETQRIRLATQLGSRLVGVLYILDEPSIGLHPRDNSRLIETLHSLRDMGNTIIVVEHDEAAIRSADWVVDLGPGAGRLGGEAVAVGSPDAVAKDRRSITGRYLSGRERIAVPAARRALNGGRALVVRGAAEHNLKDIDVTIPLGGMVCVTGVSGSGKSTLVNDILFAGLWRHFNGTGPRPGRHKRIEGLDRIDKVIAIDQAPIGRTPRSNPATYVGLFTLIRDLFCELPESKMRGYRPGRFSFNVKGGRCEACQGGGLIKIEMHFLPDVYVGCEACKGRRYNRETLEILYRGKSIADVLEMTVEEALEFFDPVPAVKAKLQTLSDVGLGYIHLGQQATTLSGGEAQRVKLSRELSKRNTGRTLYLLDEPTTGLHFHDARKLIEVLSRLVDAGGTVVIIEHNLDVIKSADWVIDLGPEGGEAGGRVVAEGTPEQVARSRRSHTGKFLRGVLNGVGGRAAKNPPRKAAKKPSARREG